MTNIPNSPTGKTVAFINSTVTGKPAVSHSPAGNSPATNRNTPSDVSGNIPGNIASGIAVQSVAQSMAIAVQDATDMLRNISTVATTAIGVATAKWIENPEMVLYKEIIQTSQGLITQAASDFLTIGQDAGKILEQFPQGTAITPENEQ